MVLFFVFALAANVFEQVASLRTYMEPVTMFMLSISLAAVGLSMDFDSLTERGLSPIYAGFLVWGIIVLGIYLFLSLI